MNIAQVLVEQARARGEAPAIVDRKGGRDRIVTFGDLDAASARFAARLAARGVEKGHAVLVLHPMSAELYAFLVAVFRVGAAAMVLDPSAGHKHMEHCLRMAPPRAFFGSAKAHLLRLSLRGLRRVPVLFSTSHVPGADFISLHEPATERRDVQPVHDGDAALITFTSGSTGEPKAAVRSHEFLRAQHEALRAALGHQAGDMDLTTLPVFVLANLASGVTSVIPDADLRRPGEIEAGPVLAQMERLRVATIAASPAFVRRLVEGCRESAHPLDGVKRVLMGGAPVFPDDLAGARAAFPSAEITAVYGSTEAEPIAEIPLSQIASEDFAAMKAGRGLLAGRTVESIALRIVRNQWGRAIAPLSEAAFDSLRLPHQTVGEIVVSGAHVLGGYLHGAGDAETKFRVGDTIWHRTGDLGWLDARGRLWLVGRASAAIEDERGVLYPFRVECAARQMRGVQQAALMAVDGRRVLVMEADDEVTPEVARAHLAWAQLDEVRRVRAIPMDKRHNAKVDYVALAKTMRRR